MKKPVFMAFAALALLAAGCADSGGSSSQTGDSGAESSPARQCGSLFNAFINCYRELKSAVSAAEIFRSPALREKEKSCRQTYRRVSDFLDSLPEGQQNKIQEQLAASGAGKAWRSCEESYFSLSLSAAKEKAVSALDSCLIPSLKKFQKTACAQL